MKRWIATGILFIVLSIPFHCTEAAAQYWNGDKNYPLIYTDANSSIYLDLSSCDRNTEHIGYTLYTVGYMRNSEQVCHYLTASFRLFMDGTDMLQVYDKEHHDWVIIPNPINDTANKDGAVAYPVEYYLFKNLYGFTSTNTHKV